MELAIVTIASITNIVVGLFIFFNNPKSYTNRFFFAFTLFAAIWAGVNYLSLHQSTPGGSLNLIRWVMFFAVSYSVSLFLMVHTFPQEKIRLSRWKLWLFLGLTFLVLILTRTSLIFMSVDGFGLDASPNPGKAIPLFALLTGFSILGAIYILVSRYRKSSGVLRTQLQYLLSGVIGSALLIFLSNFVLVIFFKTTVLLNLGPTFTLIFIIATAYAITKHGLFNAKVILAELSAVALILVNATQLFFAKSTGELLFRVLIFLLVTFFGFIFVRSVQNEVKRREEIEKLAQERSEALKELEQRNKNLATLQRIASVVLNEIELKSMAQKILDEIPRQLEACQGAFLSLVRGNELTAYAFSANEFSRKISSLVGTKLEDYHNALKADFNHLHRSILKKEMVESDKLADFISPPLSKSVATMLQTILGAKHLVAVPLFSGQEALGVMLFVYRVPKNELNEQDTGMARAVTDDMSLAIQRSEAFQKLKDANEYLSQLDKMKDEFISVASHELNTPLAAIEGYLSMILDEGMGKVDKQARTYLSRAYDSSKRLAELILDLLNVSRIEQGRLKMKYSQVSFAEMAQSVIHELEMKADTKKIYLKLEAPKSLPAVWCDPDRIREVIVNLTGNAIKFTDKGGITIKISATPTAITTAVIDTGRGIAKEDQKLLFQKFSQVKREIDEHQGTGLGLYISKNFVDLHKGKLMVDSEAGKGATFSFEIPILKAPPKEVEGAILEQAVFSAPKIEVGSKDIPQIIADSSKPPAGQTAPAKAASKAKSA